MADEKPVPETFETIAAKLTALGASIDVRFQQVDARFGQMDARFGTLETALSTTRTHLDVKIEAVDTKVDRVYDAVMTLTRHREDNLKDHERFEKRLEKHDLRILALEHRPRKRR